jgi:hypothetical protein
LDFGFWIEKMKSKISKLKSEIRVRLRDFGLEILDGGVTNLKSKI